MLYLVLLVTMLDTTITSLYDLTINYSIYYCSCLLLCVLVIAVMNLFHILFIVLRNGSK